MSILVRELFFDLADDKLDIITRSDLCCALQTVIDTKQVDRHDILCLDGYISGVSLSELELTWPNAKDRLIRTLALVEHYSGYTDELLLQRMLYRYPKYMKTADAFRAKLLEASHSL